jgi:hypothetical protein
VLHGVPEARREAQKKSSNDHWEPDRRDDPDRTLRRVGNGRRDGTGKIDGTRGGAGASVDSLRATLRLQISRGCWTISRDVRRRFVPSNPAADFSPRLDAGGVERPRRRALSTAELAQLFQKLRDTPNLGEDNLLAIRLLLAQVSISRSCPRLSNGLPRSAPLPPVATTSSRSVAVIPGSGYHTSASTR